MISTTRCMLSKQAKTMIWEIGCWSTKLSKCKMITTFCQNNRDWQHQAGAWTYVDLVSIKSSKTHLGPVSLRLMTSQFKDIVTHTQKYMTVKCTFYGVWVQNFVWNFKGALWNFTQNFEPIHRKICILRGVKDLTTYDILELWHLKS